MEPSTREISRADSLTGFDVIKYTIDLAINEQTHYVNGSVEAIVLAEENLSSLSYRLEGGTLAVTAVQVNGISAAFTHQDGLVTIPMNIAQGQQFTTKVWYSGVTGKCPTPYNIGLIYTANAVIHCPIPMPDGIGGPVMTIPGIKLWWIGTSRCAAIGWLPPMD
jgi:hypothetical protein